MAKWATAKPVVGGERSKIDDLIDFYKLPKNQYVDMRPIGPITSYAYIWFTIKVKMKDTKETKIFTVPRVCLDYDPVTEEFKGNKCPYRKALESGKYNYKVKDSNGRDTPVVKLDKKYLGNFIIRDIQEEEPNKKKPNTKKEKKKIIITKTDSKYKAFHKDMKSKSWTPIRALRVPQSLAKNFSSLVQLNKSKKDPSKVYDLADPIYGMDVSILFDPDAKGTAMYQAQKGKRNKLTEEELNYLHYYLDVVKPDDLEAAKKDWASLKDLIIPEKGSKKSKDDDDDDEDDLEDDDLEDLDDEDEKPKRKKKTSKKQSIKKKTSKTSKKSKDDEDYEDDEDDDLEDLDDDDEDIKPRRNSIRSKKTTRNKNKSTRSKEYGKNKKVLSKNRTKVKSNINDRKKISRNKKHR